MDSRSKAIIMALGFNEVIEIPDGYEKEAKEGQAQQNHE